MRADSNELELSAPGHVWSQIKKVNFCVKIQDYPVVASPLPGCGSWLTRQYNEITEYGDRSRGSSGCARLRTIRWTINSKGRTLPPVDAYQRAATSSHSDL